MSQDTIITIDKPFSFRGVTNYVDLGKTLDRLGKVIESFHDWKDKSGIGLRAERPFYMSTAIWPTEFAPEGRAGRASIHVGFYLTDETTVSVLIDMAHLGHVDSPDNVNFLVGEVSKALEDNADTAARQARFAGYVKP